MASSADFDITPEQKELLKEQNLGLFQKYGNVKLKDLENTIRMFSKILFDHPKNIDPLCRFEMKKTKNLYLLRLNYPIVLKSTIDRLAKSATVESENMDLLRIFDVIISEDVPFVALINECEKAVSVLGFEKVSQKSAIIHSACKDMLVTRYGEKSYSRSELYNLEDSIEIVFLGRFTEYDANILRDMCLNVLTQVSMISSVSQEIPNERRIIAAKLISWSIEYGKKFTFNPFMRFNPNSEENYNNKYKNFYVDDIAYDEYFDIRKDEQETIFFSMNDNYDLNRWRLRKSNLPFTNKKMMELKHDFFKNLAPKESGQNKLVMSELYGIKFAAETNENFDGCTHNWYLELGKGQFETHLMNDNTNFQRCHAQGFSCLFSNTHELKKAIRKLTKENRPNIDPLNRWDLQNIRIGRWFISFKHVYLLRFSKHVREEAIRAFAKLIRPGYSLPNNQLSYLKICYVGITGKEGEPSARLIEHCEEAMEAVGLNEVSPKVAFIHAACTDILQQKYGNNEIHEINLSDYIEPAIEMISLGNFEAMDAANIEFLCTIALNNSALTHSALSGDFFKYENKLSNDEQVNIAVKLIKHGIEFGDRWEMNPFTRFRAITDEEHIEYKKYKNPSITLKYYQKTNNYQPIMSSILTFSRLTTFTKGVEYTGKDCHTGQDCQWKPLTSILTPYLETLLQPTENLLSEELEKVQI